MTRYWSQSEADADRERRAPLTDDTPKHRAKKDRKRWCGGHVGREHQPEIRMDKYANSMGWECGNRIWLYSRNADKPPYWVCWHVSSCAKCGKILKHGTAELCPDRTETP